MATVMEVEVHMWGGNNVKEFKTSTKLESMGAKLA
jgi:hypothetical protein